MSKKTDIMAALTPSVESVEKEFSINGTVLKVNIKPFMTPKMRAAIVSDVCNHVDDGDGRNYGLLDFAFRSALVRYCTDLSVSLDGGFEAALLYGTDLYDLVRATVGYGAVGELQDSCIRQLAATIQTEQVLMHSLSQSNPFDRVSDAITDLLGGLKNVVTNIDVNTAKALLSGSIDDDTVSNLVHGIFGVNGEEDDIDGTPDLDEQADISGADEADKSGEHSADE